MAEVALPADREPFAEARRLTDRLQAQVERGDAGREQAAATAARLWALRDRWRPRFPGDDDEVDALVAGLAAAVGAACDAEEAAQQRLGGALPSCAAGSGRPATRRATLARVAGRHRPATVRDAGPLAAPSHRQPGPPGRIRTSWER